MRAVFLVASLITVFAGIAGDVGMLIAGAVTQLVVVVAATLGGAR